MFVPTCVGSLGDGAHDAGMERRGNCGWHCSTGLAYLVDRCSRYVSVVVSRGCVECMAGTDCAATRWFLFAAPCCSAFICSAARPLLSPISDPSLLLSIRSVGALAYG